MLISDYRKIEQSQNAPRVKCFYCKRRSRLKPYAGYYICKWCDTMHKVFASALLSKPVLNTGRSSY